MATPTSANVTDWTADHTSCLVKDNNGDYYVFTSASGQVLDFPTCINLVLAGTATAASTNSI